MAMGSKDDVLSVEEVAFFDELFRQPQPTLTADPHPQYLLEGSNQGFLDRLAQANELQMVARYGDYHFVFPLAMDVDEFNQLSLRFNVPEIYEVGEQLRLWRADPEQRLRIVDQYQQPLAYHIRDISPSGISLAFANGATNRPQQLQNLFLQLPDQSLIPLQGAVIREIDAQTYAYELDVDHRASRDLRNYLFNTHRRLYPHLAMPAAFSSERETAAAY